MALLKLSMLISSINGKIGGSVISSTSNGYVARQNSYTNQPLTPANSVRHVLVQQITQVYRELTQAQKDSYTNEIPNYPYINKAGDNALYNTYQLFIKLNLNLQTLNEPVKLVAPAFTAVGTVTIDQLFASITQIWVDYSGKNSTDSLIIYGAPYRNDTLVPHKREFRQVQVIVDNSVSAIVNIQTNYFAIFGVPTAGQRVYIATKSVVTNTGLANNFENITNVVAL